MYQLFLNAMSNQTNYIFFCIIFVCTIVGINCAVAGKFNNLKRFMPSLCASLGIFGTFLGVFLGLSEFDTTEIEKSVPPLLEGMKTAFFTSIIGMFCSILLHLVYSIVDDYQKNSNQEIDSLNRIHIAINSLAKRLENFFNSDTDKNSLSSQLEKICNSIENNHRDTRRAFNTMIEQFANMASGSLVNELKIVVAEFNTMLNDLVSQSFKDLTDSTIRLTQWQEEYKNIIEKNEANLNTVINGITELNRVYMITQQKIEVIVEDFENINDSLSSITFSAEKLDNLSSDLKSQNEQLLASIIKINEIGESAKYVIPEISAKINTILTEITNLQTTSIDFVAKATSEMKNANTSMSETLKNSTESISNISKKSIQDLENALQKELTDSLNSFAGAMARLSEQFVNDYLPLTNRLRELVRMAEGIKNV